MADGEPKEQHNHGSGTFVGGNVHGGLLQIFLPPYGKKGSDAASSGEGAPQPQPQPQSDENDYDGVGGTMLACLIFAPGLGYGSLHEVMGWPLAPGGTVPGVGERIGMGFVFTYVLIALISAFFARLAQFFELWSERCAITASQTRGRLVATPPALMAQFTAAVSAWAAAVAGVLASLYGWSAFGGDVSRRAHAARVNSAANATTARAAARRAAN
ncbi:hypothetical protein ACIRVF_12165 [Kitasatospora sp. NPDC101157]|uniref:hypothetical protein n=1 Tax=Kitasatospora sp. NPDC101157 TaxID=3364098 RepID=UPI00381F86F9